MIRRFEHFAGTAAAFVCAVSLAACQPAGGPLSLAEAKDATAHFQGRTFTPPPRTIDDIDALLAHQPVADPDEIAENRRRADAEPPTTGDLKALGMFFAARGEAAHALGRSGQALDDMRSAVGLFKRTDDLRLTRDGLRRLLGFEIDSGRATDSLRYRRDLLNYPASSTETVTDLSILALSLANFGRIDEAESVIEQAQSVFNTLSYNGQASSSRNLIRARAFLATALGHNDEAEAYSRQALAYSEAWLRSGPTIDYAIEVHERFELDLVKVLIKLDRPVEAEALARKVLRRTIDRVGGLSAESAIRLKILAQAIAAQGRFAEAERLYNATLDIYRKVGVEKSAFRVIRTQSALAQLLSAEGRWSDALSAAERAQPAVASPSAVETVLYRELAVPVTLSLVGLGRPEEALVKTVQALALRRSRLGDKHYDTAELRGAHAMALAASGDMEGARREFEASVPILLQRSRASASDTASRSLRARWLARILGGYVDFLARSARSARGPQREALIDHALRIANAAMAQSVGRALDANAARAAARDPDLADLVRREQDATAQIRALYGLLANAAGLAGDVGDPAASADLRQRIDRLRGARAALMEEIERRFPDYAALMNPKLAGIAEVRAALRPGESLIATFVTENKTFVWAVPKTGKVAFAEARLSRPRLAGAIAELRGALDPKAARLGDIPPFDVRLARRLYAALLEPVADGWSAAKSLLVVADGPLGQLPFSVLVTDDAPLPPEQTPLFSNHRAVAWLARRHAVTVLPSASSLVTLRGLPPPVAGRRSFAGFGDPLFAPSQEAEAEAPVQTAALATRGLIAVRGLPVSLRSAPDLSEEASADLAKLPRLPDTAEEVRGIAVALGADLTRDVFTGRAASEGRVKEMTLSGYKVLAFATHGLVPGDLDGLREPALALSAPSVVGGRDDGLLTMGEILGLKLDADWVVLSACNTASGDGAGAEAVSGLGRAFFYAGTRALLVSNWPVETTSAKALTTDIFARQAADPTLDRAEALRQAMVGMMDSGGLADANGRMIFSYAHPIFWAPFSLIGDGGGARPEG